MVRSRCRMSREETAIMYGMIEDAQDDRSLLRARVKLLYKDRPIHRHFAWAGCIDFRVASQQITGAQEDYTSVSIPFEDDSDMGPPGVNEPPLPDYVPGLEEPEQAPPLPVYLPYVPEPDGPAIGWEELIPLKGDLYGISRYDYAHSDVMSLRTMIVGQCALISELQSADHRRQGDYTSVSIPVEDDSDMGPPGVDEPPLPDYVAGPKEPEQAPPSPVYLPYVPKPVNPEYIPLEDDVFPAEEQPLPAATSPTADSPGYIPESDPKRDPEEDDEEDLEEDPADYPADRQDDDDDDVMMRRRRAPSSAIYSCSFTAVDHVPSEEETESLENDVRLRFAAPTPNYEVRESSTADANWRMDSHSVEDLMGQRALISECSVSRHRETGVIKGVVVADLQRQHVKYYGYFPVADSYRSFVLFSYRIVMQPGMPMIAYFRATGARRLLRFEKLASVYSIRQCIVACQVKFRCVYMQGNALTGLEFMVKTTTLEAAIQCMEDTEKDG
ncbi:hypothetical protein Tco_0972465 [Tanacetum coccineum]